MGSLLERLLSAAESAPAATPATLATLPDPLPVKVAESQESQGGDIEKAKKQRTRLLALATDELLAAGLVHGLGAADVAACDGYTDPELRAYLRALEQSARMDAGMVPAGYTVATVCAGCGPVWLWEGVPETFIACPWCARHKAGLPVPRPCITCQPEEAKR